MAAGQSLPDIRRPSLLPDGGDLVRTVGDSALALAWRMFQPGDRSPFQCSSYKKYIFEIKIRF